MHNSMGKGGKGSRTEDLSRKSESRAAVGDAKVTWGGKALGGTNKRLPALLPAMSWLESSLSAAIKSTLPQVHEPGEKKQIQWKNSSGVDRIPCLSEDQRLTQKTHDHQ